MRLLMLLLFLGAAALRGAGGVSAPVLVAGDERGEPQAVTQARPLDRLVILGAGAGSVEVRDGAGKVYFSAPAAGHVSFLAGGVLGRQEVSIRAADGTVLSQLGFELDASTSVDDGGKYRDMFNLFHSGMSADVPGGVESTVWNGRTYHFFVNWVLDNFHTAKGMKYFSPDITDFVEMMRAAQREDGMIWSNINQDSAVDYYLTAYGPFGYIRKIGDRYFVRQPTENHPEYIYVSTIYQSWKAGAGDAWMQAGLASAQRALDYSITDPARWSRRFQLLKRVLTIDSWDFEVDDAYTPDIGLTNTMLIDPEKSKFGVFFGDNVHYAAACDELAEMLAHAGDATAAAKYRARGTAIRERLDAVSWNGRFYTHFVDEDPSVHRDLGVDLKTQIAQGNAYALNRGIGREHAVAILNTYLDLKNHLPTGSPGEWYAIYPPFQKGFGQHDAVWQYMNGGVGGHVAGELARGAFANGFEAYGRDILDRLTALGHRYGNKISFAYTGSIPPAPPPPHYRAVSLAAVANMDLSNQGGTGAIPWMQMPRPGDDVRGLPVGRQQFSGIDFEVTDPAANQRKAAVAVSHRPGFPVSIDIPVQDRAGAIYLLHTATKPTSENVCGSVALVYADGSRDLQYIIMGKQLTFWWFPELKTERSGVAWHGPSPVSHDVGLSWCAIDNPHPEKVIAAIQLQAPADNGIYAVAGLTLADRAHFLPPNPVSYGGPDDWAAATAMAAMVEGLAGVTDGPLSQAFAHPIIAPRWDPGEDREIRVAVRYPASGGYVAYRYVLRPAARELVVTITGSGAAMDGHFLLPSGVETVISVTVDDEVAAASVTAVGTSHYLDLPLQNTKPGVVRIRF